MKSLAALFAVSLMLGSAGAWADSWKHESGHGRHAKHWNKHAEKEWKKEHKHWHKHGGHYGRHFDGYAPHYPREVVRYYPAPRVREHYYYVEPAPVYAPPPGIHVVTPDIYIPF